MRVSPREFKAVRSAGLLTRYATLGEAVFVIAEVPPDGSAETSLEEDCRLEHWGFVVKGELSVLRAGQIRTFTPGTAFYIAPGPRHRLAALPNAVIAGFAPIVEPIDDSPDALRSRGIELVRRTNRAALPPTSIRVEGLRTHTVVNGSIETESAVMGDWLFTRTTFGALSGHLQPWCDLPHWGLALDGDLLIRWEDGELELLGRGDAFHCPKGPPAHRIEVADAATIVDYTPIGALDNADLRRAPRSMDARAAGGSPDPLGARRVPA